MRTWQTNVRTWLRVFFIYLYLFFIYFLFLFIYYWLSIFADVQAGVHQEAGRHLFDMFRDRGNAYC